MPYLTVEEMRKNVDFVKKGLDTEIDKEEGGSRFVGSTDADMALKLFRKDGAILECGPASGRFTKVLQDNGFNNIHVLDFVDIMTFPDRKNLTYHEVDFNKDVFPYPDKYFNGVTAWGVMEHMEDPYHFSREVHRVLKNDHYFLMAVPSIFHWWSRLIFLKAGLFPRWNHRNNHIAIFPHGVFEKIFLRYFTLEQTMYTRPSLRLNIFGWTSKCIPANEWFGNYVIYVLKRKEFVPFVPKRSK
ncbi:MAG: methyltransferase domain-containing protein [bacterium]|nr:methyltransferase domain-containing protein [bacterium]